MIVVFTGPTLPAAEAANLLDAVFLPPVSQGDVYRASRIRPQAIAIIDGYFDRVPSVWHKEILWALNEGIRVFGAASMGALRAAELAPFGMEGVGAIFEAFRDGVLFDDDEVAVAHASAEHGYRPLSEPMVNIRFTLRAAEAAGVITADTAQHLEGEAKSLYYPDRIYPRIINLCANRVYEQELQQFKVWLQTGSVNQKRLDAEAMLQRIARTDFSDLPPKVSFHFENTTLWSELRNSAGELHIYNGKANTQFRHDVVSNLTEAEQNEALLGAIARRLALDESYRHGLIVDEDRLYATIIDFRQRLGLYEADALEKWMADNHLDRAGYIQLMADQSRVEWTYNLLSEEGYGMITDYMRCSGKFSPKRNDS